MSTFIQLKTLLRSMVGNPSVTDVPDEFLGDRLNEAYKEIATKYKLYNARKLCTFDTVVGQAQYANPTDCYAVLRIRDNTSGTPLDRIGDSRYTHRADSATNPMLPGAPIAYTRYRNFIVLVPTPDDIYQLEIYYSATPSELSGDGDVPVIPDPWHVGIARLARAYYFDLKGDMPKSMSAQTIYSTWLATMPSEIEEEVEFMDATVEIPTLQQGTPRRDFDHSA